MKCLPKNGDRLCGSKMSRMGVAFTLRPGRMGSGEPVQRVAVIGEWGVGNEWSGLRCWERGELGTSAAGSDDGRVESGKVGRV